MVELFFGSMRMPPAQLNKNQKFTKMISAAKVCLLILMAILFGSSLLFSGQLGDLRHSVTYSDGLFREGLDFYLLGPQRGYGGSDYLPSLYFLLHIALLPSSILEGALSLSRCGLGSPSSCILETASLKLSIIFLCIFWIFLLKRAGILGFSHILREALSGDRVEQIWMSIAKHSMAILFVPAVLYSWLLFGAYDGLGAFSTLIGGTLFFRRVKLSGSNQFLAFVIAVIGLLMAGAGISCKFLPLFLLVGLCIGISKSWSDACFGLGVPIGLAVCQIHVAQRFGGNPLRIVAGKLAQLTKELYSVEVAFGLLIAFTLFIIYYSGKSKNRMALGSLSALGFYSILYPSIVWHPQWQLYYGVALISTVYSLNLTQSWTYISLSLITLQSIFFGGAVQMWQGNADITMAFTVVHRVLVPSINESFHSSPYYFVEPAWRLYSLSQILLLLVMSALFVAQTCRQGRSFSIHADARSVYLVPGAVFICSWYFLALCSSLADSMQSARLKIASGMLKPFVNRSQAGNTFQSEHSSFNPLKASLGNSSAIQLGNQSSYEFGSAYIPNHAVKVDLASIVIGNNFNSSRGHLELCIRSRRPALLKSDISIKEPCISIDLRKTNDNVVTLLDFPAVNFAAGNRLALKTTLESGSPRPILYLTASGNPAIVLYGRSNSPFYYGLTSRLFPAK